MSQATRASPWVTGKPGEAAGFVWSWAPPGTHQGCWLPNCIPHLNSSHSQRKTHREKAEITSLWRVPNVVPPNTRIPRLWGCGLTTLCYCCLSFQGLSGGPQEWPPSLHEPLPPQGSDSFLGCLQDAEDSTKSLWWPLSLGLFCPVTGNHWTRVWSWSSGLMQWFRRSSIFLLSLLPSWPSFSLQTGVLRAFKQLAVNHKAS